MTDAEEKTEKYTLPVIGKDFKPRRARSAAADDLDIEQMTAFNRLPQCVQQAYIEMKQADAKCKASADEVTRLDKEIKQLDIHEKLAAKIKQLESQRHK